MKRAYLSAFPTQAPRISGIWPPMFAAIAAINKRNAMLSAKTSGIRLTVGSRMITSKRGPSSRRRRGRGVLSSRNAKGGLEQIGRDPTLLAS
jgi:hypothetical protein